MLKIKDVVNIIEDFAPLEYQLEFDNSGLLYGDLDNEVKGILVTLDTNVEVIREAIELGCNMIIEHHPTNFTPLKQFDLTLPTHKALVMAIANNIAIYSAHTSVDFTDGGLNDYVAEKLGLKDVSYIGDRTGARIGELVTPLALKDVMQLISETFNDKHVYSVGDEESLIKKIAVINGGGGGSIDNVMAAKEAGADVFITSDFKYHVLRFAKDVNYAIIYFGHYDSEICFIDLISTLMEKNGLKNITHKAKNCLNPCN